MLKGEFWGIDLNHKLGIYKNKFVLATTFEYLYEVELSRVRRGGGV